MTCYHVSEVTDNMAWQYDISDNTVLEKMLRIHIPRMFISKTFFFMYRNTGKKRKYIKRSPIMSWANVFASSCERACVQS